jgi:N6-L-threonylcarbamoyladenine synthase
LQQILEREPELHDALLSFLVEAERPDIDAIAVTHGPGLEPALWVGVNLARALSRAWNIPIVPVNHMEGHLLSILAQKSKIFTFTKDTLQFPMLSLLISGGHTELVLVKEFGKYKVIGSTRDDAAGEAFDKVARMLDLPYPGGPEIARLAKIEREMNPTSTEITLPRPMIHTKDYDFSFSGLKTAVLYLIRDIGKEKIDEKMKSKIAKEFEDAVVEVLLAKTLRALEEHKIKTLILGGGVSSNIHLQKTFKASLKKFTPKTAFHFPTKTLSTDNALMIAIAGYFQYSKKNQKSRNAKLSAQGNLAL